MVGCDVIKPEVEEWVVTTERALLYASGEAPSSCGPLSTEKRRHDGSAEEESGGAYFCVLFDHSEGGDGSPDRMEERARLSSWRGGTMVPTTLLVMVVAIGVAVFTPRVVAPASVAILAFRSREPSDVQECCTGRRREVVLG